MLLPLALAVTNEGLKGCSPSARSAGNFGLLIDSELTFTDQTAGQKGIGPQGCGVLPSKEMYSCLGLGDTAKNCYLLVDQDKCQIIIS